MFSIAGVGNFGGCARKANRQSSLNKTLSVHSEIASVPKESLKSPHRLEKDLKETATDNGNGQVEGDGRSWTVVVGQRRASCSSTDDDSSILVKHFCRQQSASDAECSADDHADSSVLCGTTNSLDRRHFQNARRNGKSAAGRSIVGAVKKSVNLLLGHLSAVSDVTAAKPRCIETWSSCSDLMQASAKLRCQDNVVNLADRHRVAGCQFARELRRNRSEREAQFNDTNKSSSSHLIRVRSRDFDTLVSKFATPEQTSVTSVKSDTASD